MSQKAQKRIAKIMAEAHANYDKPGRIPLPDAMAYRTKRRIDRPNKSGTRKVSKLARRVMRGGFTVNEKRELSK